MTAWSGHARQGARHDLDDTRVCWVRRQREHPVVSVGVLQGEAAVYRIGCAEHVGREVDGLLRYVLDRITLDHPSEPFGRFFCLLRPDHDLLATVAAPALYDQLSRSEERRVGKECRSRW